MTKLWIAIGVAVVIGLGAGVASAEAQSLGIKGGANLSTVAVKPSGELGEVSSKPGALGGGFITFRDASKLSLEVAGLLSLRRIAFGPDILDTITYVEAPVVARYRVMSRPGLQVRALAGVSPNFRLKASESIVGTSSDVTAAYKAVEVAVVVGAQAEWNKKWLVEARYLFGVTGVYEVTLGSERTRQRGLQILAGYRLR